jgi:hypothetical protein
MKKLKKVIALTLDRSFSTSGVEIQELDKRKFKALQESEAAKVQ